MTTNGVDSSKRWSKIVAGKGDMEYAKASGGSGLIDALVANISYLKQITPGNIIGGARAIWDSLTKGNWGFFKDWASSEETPVIAKLSAAGAFILGGLAAGKAALVAGAKIAATSLGKFAIGAGVSTLFTRQEMVEKSFNFFEKALEVDFNRSTEKFFKYSVKRLQELAKNIATDLISLGGRSLARVIVDQVGKVYMEVDRRLLGILSLTMSEQVMEDIYDSLGSIGSQLWSLAKDVASEAALLMGRDLLADWGLVPKPNDQEEMTLSAKIQKDFKVLSDAAKIPDWLQESLSEGSSEFYQVFRDGLTERAGIIDLARRQQIRFVPY
ncbi:MAG: hypothetical protein QNJ68_10335 [Microcoleaceae cyanobacterium MO_207.B10]|nr:hypothetical protein [Microcoleaceae cyanobacterium MO_207.B10]